jgi:ribosomal protein S18 acetylase RimI-like enzyme
MEGKVVGFILADLRGAEYALPLGGWIDSVGVDPEYQGRGIGRKLIDSFIEECHVRGIKARSMVRDSDQHLQKLLLSLGFQRGEFIEFVKGFASWNGS